MILLDKNYFTRLWCMYELAYYVKHAGVDRVDMLELEMDSLVWYMIFSIWVLCEGLSLNAYAVSVHGFPQEVKNLVFLLLAIAAMAVMINKVRRSQRGHEELLARVRTWRLEHAECAVPADRIFVESHIRAWFSHSPDPIAHFEQIVQRDIHRLMTRKLGGRLTVRPLYAAVLLLPAFWRHSSSFPVGDPFGHCMHILMGVRVVLTHGPVMVMVITEIVRRTITAGSPAT